MVRVGAPVPFSFIFPKSCYFSELFFEKGTKHPIEQGTFVPFLHENTVPGMITSVIIVFIATANLFLDFARIEEAVNKHIDEKYECYLAFGLTVTLIWLYLEILRLLGKSRSRE